MKPDPRDGTALLVMLAIILGLGMLANTAERLPIPKIDVLEPVALALVAVGAVALVAVLALRRWGIGRALSRRVRVQMVPTDGFDPRTRGDPAVRRRSRPQPPRGSRSARSSGQRGSGAAVER